MKTYEDINKQVTINMFEEMDMTKNADRDPWSVIGIMKAYIRDEDVNKALHEWSRKVHDYNKK